MFKAYFRISDALNVIEEYKENLGIFWYHARIHDDYIQFFLEYLQKVIFAVSVVGFFAVLISSVAIIYAW